MAIIRTVPLKDATSTAMTSWATPLTTGSVASTFQQFWRAEWGMTTSGESYKFLPWMGIQ
jgi:hypothetical protein